MTMQIEIEDKNCQTYDLSQAPLWEPLEVIETTRHNSIVTGDIVVVVQDVCCNRYVLLAQEGFGSMPALLRPNYKVIFKRPNKRCEVRFVNEAIY